MKYKKYGASYHLVINNTKDLLEILTLHPSLWISTSAPLQSFIIDKTFLNYIDTDANGRIICSEVKNSIEWLSQILKEYCGINESLDYFKLEWLASEKLEDCEKIINTVNNILKITDKESEINLDQIQTIKAEVEKNPVSESGVALIDAAKSKEISEYMQLVINVTDGEDHPSGIKGVSKNCLTIFNTNLNSYITWYKQYLEGKDKKDNEFLPLGDSTKDAFDLYLKLKDKISQFFIQCKAYSFSKQASDKLNLLNDSEIEQISWKETDKLETFLLNSPLAYPNETYSINIDKDFINPLYSDDLNKFIELISQLSFDKESRILDESKWLKVSSSLIKYKTWFEENPCHKLDKIDYPNLVVYSNLKYTKNVEKIIALSDSTAKQLNNIRLVEKLVLFQKYILQFVNNFVSFPILYDPELKALFERGSLIIDGRQMNLCIHVEDINNHIKIAKNSNLYVLYAQITPAKEEPYTVAVPVTNGIKGNLNIGKRGIFIDINKNISDASIIDMIENPISLRETLIYPFKKICSIFTSKFDSLNKEADRTLGQMTTDTLDGKSVAKDKSLLKNKNSIGGFNPATLIMGGGVALAALGSSITYIATQLATVSFYKILIAIVAIIILLLAPAVISSFIKLRRRDLSSILEGSGWAINAKMTLTRRLCKLFTQDPKWPKKAGRKWGA
ncbi:MAG: hypothetical protein GY756_08185 [bacterium]|nr:hypothetical protein [bacterium]